MVAHVSQSMLVPTTIGSPENDRPNKPLTTGYTNCNRANIRTVIDCIGEGFGSLNNLYFYGIDIVSGNRTRLVIKG